MPFTERPRAMTWPVRLCGALGPRRRLTVVPTAERPDIPRIFRGDATPADARDENAFPARKAKKLPPRRARAQRAAGLFGPVDPLFNGAGTTTIALAAERARRIARLVTGQLPSAPTPARA